ncbi:hypothetical protein [Ralstonia solanacearum]|uniref:hypothetical protein n=1 Tax=Ralstonia solanacearum TaxID=305 RepID=UPI003D80475F
MNKIIAILIVTATATLAGCGAKSGSASVAGTYVDKDGSKLVFEGSKVKAVGGTSAETDFTVTGNTLKYKFANGFPVEATINGDGTFTTNYGYVYKKAD